MTEPDVQNVLGSVPIGHANAVPSRAIWRKADRWSLGWTDRALLRLLNEGKVARRQEVIPSGFRWVYWRSA